MRTFDIDEEIPHALYAVRWGKNEENALNKAIVQLQDPEYLTRFFMKNQDKLFFFDCTVTEAVTRTHGQTNRFLQEMRTRAKNATLYETPDLDELFTPLHKEAGYFNRRFHTDYKATGPEEIPWIRIYAVRCDENLYVITGFGIKLVKKMQEDILLNKEIDKLEKATSYLKTIGML
ncbi:MAG TPA: hypothetical protein VK021_13540 [Flavobacteriaceae bacterium]|nr:hypothetical protein [Flavobacteriaceae bacterium]